MLQTAKYPDLITDGVANTSMLDGIFKLEAIGTAGSATYMFEQYIADTFVWNNLGDVSIDMEDVTAYTYNRTLYDSQATYSYWTAEDMAKLTTYDGSVIPAGEYHAATTKQTLINDNSIALNLRIFPTHTWAYYEAFWNGATVSYTVMPMAKVDTENFGGKGNSWRYDCYPMGPGYVNANGEGASKWNYSNRYDSQSSRSITMTLSAYVRLSCTNYTDTPTASKMISAAYFGGVKKCTNANAYNPGLTVFVGNFSATMPTA